MGICQAIDRYAVRFPVKWMLLIFGFILEFMVALPFAMVCRFESGVRRRASQDRVRPEAAWTEAAGNFRTPDQQPRSLYPPDPPTAERLGK